MSEEELNRVIEVEFFYTIRTLLKMYPNIDDVFSFIEGLSRVEGLNALAIRARMQMFMSQTEMFPSTMETILLLFKAGYKANIIAEWAGRSTRTVHNWANKYKNAWPLYTARTDDETIKIIKQFLQALQNISQIGRMLS